MGAVLCYLRKEDHRAKHHHRKPSMITNVGLSEYKRVNPVLSDKLKAELMKKGGNSKILQTNYIKKALDTELLIRYTMDFMSKRKSCNIKNAGKRERMFINAIGEIAGYGKIFVDETESIDIERYDYHHIKHGRSRSFIIDLKDLESRLLDQNFQYMWKAKLSTSIINDMPLMITQNSGGRIDNEGYYHPVFTNIDANNQEVKELPKIGKGVDKNIYVMLQGYLENILKDNYNYRYEKDQYGNYILYIKKSEGWLEEAYLIDIGRIMGGNDPYILAHYIRNDNVRDTIFVNIRLYPEIVKNVLSSSLYNLTDSEIADARRCMFNNDALYFNIDLSNTSFMDSISIDDRNKLEDNLLKAMSMLSTKDSGTLRFRFNKYVDPANFVLESKGAISPLAFLRCNASVIDEDLKIYVHKNSIAIYKGDKQYSPAYIFES